MQESVRLGAVRKAGRPFHVLTEDKVAQIMALKGQKSQREIGEMFGVKGKQIGRIHRGECWIGGKRRYGGGDQRNSPRYQAYFAARRATQ